MMRYNKFSLASIQSFSQISIIIGNNCFTRANGVQRWLKKKKKSFIQIEMNTLQKFYNNLFYETVCQEFIDWFLFC